MNLNNHKTKGEKDGWEKEKAKLRIKTNISLANKRLYRLLTIKKYMNDEFFGIITKYVRNDYIAFENELQKIINSEAKNLVYLESQAKEVD